jgi:hypothetical protein
MGNCCGRAGAFSRIPASCLGRSGIDNCRSRGCRASCSRGCRSGDSPQPGVHTTQCRISHRCYYRLHRGGHLRLCGNGVLSEPGPHMASSFGNSPHPVACALRVIGDFSHHGGRLARGLRSHDDACGRVGGLRDALTLARDHEGPTQSPGCKPSPLNSLATAVKRDIVHNFH